MIITHEIGKTIALDVDRSRPLFTYDYGNKPRPYFHPLHTLGGNLLTNYEPTDHVWHRGLWFTFKFVNGVNFWEEYDGFGRQVTVGVPEISHEGPSHTALRQELVWRGPDGTEYLSEQREIAIRVVSESAYHLDFSTDLTAITDLTLDRTPFTTWGGYGGLVLRGNRNWVDTKITLAEGSSTDRPTGVTGNWASLAGPFDGGVGLRGGAAIFDAPSNVRHPSPWYGGTGIGHYLNAALLFHEPLAVAIDEHLKLAYRVVIFDGDLTVDETAALYDEYAQSRS